MHQRTSLRLHRLLILAATLLVSACKSTVTEPPAPVGETAAPSCEDMTRCVASSLDTDAERLKMDMSNTCTQQIRCSWCPEKSNGEVGTPCVVADLEPGFQAWTQEIPRRAYSGFRISCSTSDSALGCEERVSSRRTVQ